MTTLMSARTVARKIRQLADTIERNPERLDSFAIDRATYAAFSSKHSSYRVPRRQSIAVHVTLLTARKRSKRSKRK